MTSPSRLQTFRIAVRKFPPFEAAIRAQWAAFEETNRTGLRLDLVSMDLQQLQEALFTSGGMSSGDWDVAFIASDWVSSMHSMGCAVDLRTHLKRDPPPDYPAGWSPSLLRLQRFDGRVLGVPYHDGPECLIYRRDLFDDPDRRRSFRDLYGRELAPPRTWNEFHEIARFLNDPAQDLYGAAFAAYPDGHNSVYDFLLQLWTRGGELHSPSGEMHLNTPEAHAGLSFYRDIVTDRSASHPNCLQLDSVGLGERFAAGEVAMMINWFGFAAHAQISSDSSVRGVVDIACIPAENRGKSVSLNVYWILSLPEGSPHRELAWQFLRHTQTPEMDKITSTSGAIGCRRSTWSDPDVIAEIPFYRQMEALHANAREIPRQADWRQIASIIDTLITRSVSTDISISALLEEADAELHRIR
jgi:multiple sugar transport system substrate-binding protein